MNPVQAFLQLPTEENIVINTARARKKDIKIDWESKKMVYEMLCQYYVHQSSIVFIVDSVFESEWHKNKAN